MTTYEYSIKEQFVEAAKKLAEKHINLRWISNKQTILKGYEGEGLYEINKITLDLELVFNPETDISFEWEGSEYSLIPYPRNATKLICWQCTNDNLDDQSVNPKESLGFYLCPKCDRSFENGEYL